MSSAHEKYLYAHNELQRAKSTRALINSPYEGGGGCSEISERSRRGTSASIGWWAIRFRLTIPSHPYTLAYEKNM